jgi:16S rRNA (cytosine967-C5)-methyltransferase
MRTSSLLGHVVELLDLVRGSRQPVDRVVRDFFRGRRYLGSADRRFVSEYLYGIVRNLMLLEAYARKGSEQAWGEVPDRAAAVILCAAYAVRIAGVEGAALAEDLALPWRLAAMKHDLPPLIAALKEADLNLASEPVQRQLSILYSFPEGVVSEWVGRYGAEAAEELCRSLNIPAPTVLRVNRLKTDVASCMAALAEEGITASPGRLVPDSLVLEKRVSVQTLKTFHRGFFEMQDEGSQAITLLLEPQPGEIVVDACAGGGGKTLHCAALMENRGSIIATDVDEARLGNLVERVRRAGVTIARVVTGDEQNGLIRSMAGRADRVLVDAPCSGMGTVRRNPGLKSLYSEAGSRAMAQTQLGILNRYSSLVRPGGRLVYSTCTLLRRENEEVVSAFLAARPEFTLLPAAEVLRKHAIAGASTDYMRLTPADAGSDGFFAALLARATA